MLITIIRALESLLWQHPRDTKPLSLGYPEQNISYYFYSVGSGPRVFSDQAWFNAIYIFKPDLSMHRALTIMEYHASYPSIYFQLANSDVDADLANS